MLIRRMSKIFLIVVVMSVSVAEAQYVGLDFYDNLSDMARLSDDAESYYISSYDRTGGNNDGFTGKYSALYVDDNGEHVLFEEDSPGCIYNFWFTGNRKRPDCGKIRFYFDGEKEPRIDITADDIFTGLTPPFVYPLATHADISSGGVSCSMPIPFAKSLKVTTEKRVGFYNMYYQLYKDKKFSSWTGKEDYSFLKNIFESCGKDPKQRPAVQIARKTVTLALRSNSEKFGKKTEIFSTEQGGTIQHIKINPLFPIDIHTLNKTYIIITFDGQEEPSVNVPLGPFFGSGLGEADMKGLFVGMSSSGTYYCYFAMPFKSSARIELQNNSGNVTRSAISGRATGGRYFCEIGYSNEIMKDSEAGKVGYFGARYNKTWPISERNDYVLLDYQGTGAVIGQVMTVEPVHLQVRSWWEGDMRISIDDDKQPRFNGTGHEDEYMGGWSDFWLENPYSQPLFGLPKTTNVEFHTERVNGSATMYRFWPGKIPFKKQIRISSEHGTENGVPANYSSLVYYYYLPQ